MELVAPVEPALLDKPVCEGVVSATEIVLLSTVDLITAEMNAVNVFPDRPVSTVYVLEPVLHNAPEPSMVKSNSAVGIDVEVPVEVVPLASAAKMESVCAILNVPTETVDLMVVAELAEPVSMTQSVEQVPVTLWLELAILLVSDVAMEFAPQMKLLLLFEPFNSTKPTAHKTVVPLLGLSLLPSDKKIN